MLKPIILAIFFDKASIIYDLNQEQYVIKISLKKQVVSCNLLHYIEKSLFFLV